MARPYCPGLLAFTKEKSGSLNVAKCRFCVRQIQYLGQILSVGNIRPAEYNVQAYTNIPRPRNVSKVRPFLGAADARGVGLSGVLSKIVGGEERPLLFLSASYGRRDPVRLQETRMHSSRHLSGCARFCSNDVSRSLPHNTALKWLWAKQAASGRAAFGKFYTMA